MKHRGWTTILLAFTSWACSMKEAQVVPSREPASYVNPFIGTGGKGKTYPGATVPFGMVQLSPDNGRSGWDWISGYFYPDSIIAGFSHTHLSGTGIGDLYDISFMPVTAAPPETRSDSLSKAVGSQNYSHFSHQQESAHPGYYQVYLKDYGVNVELTATARTGFQKYTTDHHDSLTVFLNLGYSRNWDATTAASIHIDNDTLITGYRKSSGWAPDQRVYFASTFSRPFEWVHLYSGDSAVMEKALTGKNIKAALGYSTQQHPDIVIKTAISSVSIENALQNLRSEAAGLTFEAAKAQAGILWNDELSKIKVTSSNSEALTSFYTALYQSMLAPTLFSDVNGEYKGADGHIHKAQGYDRYTTFSLWDTFRAEHPLLTLLQPDRVDDFINSMLAHKDEYGYLPVWDLAGNETNMMIGYHAVPVIADAYLKGFRGFDANRAYQAMKKSAEADHFGLKAYKKYGYVPAGKDNNSVSLTLEYAYDDWCIAQMARALGNNKDYEIYSKRAENYRNLFDKNSNFMRARDSVSQWQKSFFPLKYNTGDYIEANAWQYTWFVPHEPKTLVDLMGGKKAFREKLDSLFITPHPPGKVPEWISGNIGQYVHGNEPCHHIAYLYNFTDQPWKTQSTVVKIRSELYHPEPAGLCGNEDCGQMSAWYIFSALGFYPLNPVGGVYQLGTPLFEKVRLTLPKKKQLLIKATDVSGKNIYVQQVTFNGKEITSGQLTHHQLLEGGELVFTMGPKPNKSLD